MFIQRKGTLRYMSFGLFNFAEKQMDNNNSPIYSPQTILIKVSTFYNNVDWINRYY